MNEYVFFLGSHPALSAIEIMAALERAQMTASVVTYTDQFLILSTTSDVPSTFLSRLGGTSRIAQTLATVKAIPSPVELLDLFGSLPPKLAIGFSALTSQNIKFNKYGVEVKKAARARGTKVQFILPAGSKQQLNAAQVLFNSLYKAPNIEVTFLEHNGQMRVLKTVGIQDIEQYEMRDTRRPARDARVGMLPPKLAQVMISIALREVATPAPVILDPFCGSGTIMQEAWLMGIRSIGSDVSSNMTAASLKNLTWLSEHFTLDESVQPEVAIHDVRTPMPGHWTELFDAIVTEPFLGTPLSTPLPLVNLPEWQQSVSELYIKAFENIFSTLKKDGVVLFLMPAVKTQDGRYTPLPVTVFDEIKKAGYSMLQLVPAALEPFISPTDRGTLLYSRPDALVAREFTLWKKIS